jgi:NTP pyrophosphatase (non-canonical NTP hydrolase)
MDTAVLSREVEEVSQLYARKFGIDRDDDWFVLKLQEEMGELIQAYLMQRGKARKKGMTEAEIRREFEGEVGDVLCHVLLLAKHFGVDIDRTVTEKWLKWKK